MAKNTAVIHKDTLGFHWPKFSGITLPNSHTVVTRTENYATTCLKIQQEDREHLTVIPANRVNIRQAQTSTEEVITFEGPNTKERAETFFAALWNEDISVYLTLTNQENQGFWNHLRFLAANSQTTIGYFTMGNIQRVAQHATDPHAPADVEIWSADISYKGETRKVVHLSYDTWPDAGTIAGNNDQAIQKLRLIADQLHQHGATQKKMALNCNAGVSRTCCALIAHLAYERHLQGAPSNLAVLQEIVRAQTPYKEEPLQTLQLQLFIEHLNAKLLTPPQPAAAAAAVAEQPVAQVVQPQATAYRPLPITLAMLHNTDSVYQIIGDNILAWFNNVAAERGNTFNASINVKRTDAGVLRLVCMSQQDTVKLKAACDNAGIGAQYAQETTRRRATLPCIDIAQADVNRFVFDILQIHKGANISQEQQCHTATTQALTQSQKAIGF